MGAQLSYIDLLRRRERGARELQVTARGGYSGGPRNSGWEGVRR